MAGVVQPANVSDIRCDIPKLKGYNYNVWKEIILLQWERSSRLSVTFIKTKISTGILGSVDQHDKVRYLIKAIDDQFVTSNKALASTLNMKFSSMKFTSVRGVREHIMQRRDIVAELKKLEVEMSDFFLVHYILNTLLPQYGPFKISYNTHKDKWSINELMIMCVQEEGRLVMEVGESSMMVTQGKGKAKAYQKGEVKYLLKLISRRNPSFFFKKKGRMEKDCAKFKKWLETKGIGKSKPE